MIHLSCKFSYVKLLINPAILIPSTILAADRCLHLVIIGLLLARRRLDLASPRDIRRPPGAVSGDPFRLWIDEWKGEEQD